jgi:short-subunit dehydrogenase involved in D-alanine esterification of teichoic acids
METNNTVIIDKSTTENKAPQKKEINIHDIDKLTDSYVAFVSDNIPTDKQNYYTNMLYNNINNMYKILINSAGMKELERLERENERLREAIDCAENHIGEANYNIESALYKLQDAQAV